MTLFLRCQYYYPIDDIKTEILLFENENIFKVTNLSDLVTIVSENKSSEDQEMSIHDSLLLNLIGISIGTMRGILFSKTIG